MWQVNFRVSYALSRHRRSYPMSRLWAIALILTAPGAAPSDDPPKADKVKEIAGTAEFLRSVPKHFAKLTAIDAANRRVSLVIDGETSSARWELAPDAEIKVLGWWGRLEQFCVGDHVWVWFATDRTKKPISVMMIADEISEK